MIQAEEYAELKKFKMRNNPPRGDAKHEDGAKWKQEAMKAGKNIKNPSSKVKSSNQSTSVIGDNGGMEAVAKRMARKASVKPSSQVSQEGSGHGDGEDTAEEFEDDEEDDDAYAIRRRDEAVTIPVFSTNSIVTFCADDWVNKLLEIESMEKIKLTEMDYLLSY